MNFNNDQFSAMQKNSMEVLTGLSQKTFTGFEKLVELNMAAAKAVMGDSLVTLETLSTAKDASALMSLQAGLLQPMGEKAASYSRHLYEIMSSTGTEVAQALESTTAESKKAVNAFVETSLKKAPAGSEAAVAAFKSAFEAGNNAVESAQKTAQQSAQQTAKMVESSLNAVSSAAHKAN